MGFLTTLTISNDSLDILKDDPKQVCDKIYDAAISGKVKTLSHHYNTGIFRRGNSQFDRDCTELFYALARTIRMQVNIG